MFILFSIASGSCCFDEVGVGCDHILKSIRHCFLTQTLHKVFVPSSFNIISFTFLLTHIRSDDAIEILEYVVGMREEKLGTANPDVEDERQRLSALLKEAGKVRNRKSRRLETLLDTNTDTIKDEGVRVL